jgi:hypothetical protein
MRDKGLDVLNGLAQPEGLRSSEDKVLFKAGFDEQTRVGSGDTE